MKKLSFLSRSLCLEVGFVILLGVFCIVQAQDFVPGQIMLDIKHEYLPITPTPNGGDIIETGLSSTQNFHLLLSELFLNIQKKNA